ncbi:hypothetical protein PPERSA_09507 [Pseudocohnilembus persalinus]|uniref:Tim44-like domain-containing protein n=1 Tax=Pseudocohnilembus persalinus TaxID=266149 RepID=A0A0V0QFH7_PSEPJ|nr:hypothetical protein PPERSA_09507 [Pseudocohnilembus persalinus]|eukprot:KRX00901.1 hypothetical protein PPERSA_09507 [Pseudocohnilembus persalinus]
MQSLAKLVLRSNLLPKTKNLQKVGSYQFSQQEDAFFNLKNKINQNKSDEEIKSEYYKDQKQKKNNESNEQNNQNLDNVKTKENEENIQKQQKKKKIIKQKGYMESLQEQNNFLGKSLKFGIEAWQQTFPDEKEMAQKRLLKAKEQAKKLREEQQNMKEYTEEELEEIQQNIPEWKKNALQKAQNVEEKQSIASKLKGKVKAKFNKTEFASNLYKSEEYKEYQTFKTEMSQFKEDFKDHVHNSPSNLVQGGLYVIDKASSEHQIAKSIKEMRKYDPEFDLWELEKESRVIFETAYNHYLEGDIDILEKYCSEQALGYFKTLIKQRKAQNCSPKYKQLWTCDRSMFNKAFFPDSILPVFQFNIKMQEIYCNVDDITGKIVDGSDDRVMAYDFIFGVRLHTDPDLETVGHKWELIEVQPQQVVKMLV